MKVGDEVVCIQSFVSFKGSEYKITKGEVYEVLGVSNCGTGICIRVGPHSFWGKRFFRKRDMIDTKAIAESFSEVIETSPIKEPEYA